MDNIQQLISEVHRRDLGLPSPAPGTFDFQLDGLSLSDDEEDPSPKDIPKPAPQACAHR